MYQLLLIKPRLTLTENSSANSVTWDASLIVIIVIPG